MTKPLNQEEKERLAAYQERFKSIDDIADHDFVLRCAHRLVNKYHSSLSTPNIQLLHDSKELFDFANLLEREHL